MKKIKDDMIKGTVLGRATIRVYGCNNVWLAQLMSTYATHMQQL